jgi:hypothetical protein
VLESLYDAFCRANALADATRLEHIRHHRDLGLLSPDGFDALKTPVMTYGRSANQTVLEAIAGYSFEQGLSSRLVPVEEIFPTEVGA